MAGTIEITDDNFEAEVLQSDVPVLVDFWAEWCQPCRMLSPVIESLAEDYQGRVKIGKINTEDARTTAMNYRIMALPTIMIFKNGEAVNQMGGVQSKERLIEELDKMLADSA
jgi:thioredoxin 1